MIYGLYEFNLFLIKSVTQLLYTWREKINKPLNEREKKIYKASLFWFHEN